VSYNSLAAAVAVFLAAVFGASAVAHLTALRFVRRAYERWRFPPGFYRVTGLIELLTAVFLFVPQTRIWGVILAALLTFAAVITLLNNRQYIWSVPGILIMLGLLPTAVIGPLQGGRSNAVAVEQANSPTLRTINELLR
jgi:DoxX-like family